MSSSSRASKNGTYEESTTHAFGHVAESAARKTTTREITPDSSDAVLAFRVREDDGILAEVMKVLEHFVELRKYIEHSHDGLSNRLEKVEGGLQRLEGRVELVEGGLACLEGKVDAGFDRLGRKIDALAPVRRPASRRRKP